MKNIVSLENVSFLYRGRESKTLNDINLNIKQGEFVLLTGPTGCGKSTILKTLNGLIPHESGGQLTGNVYIDGKDTRSEKIIDLSKLVGLVFQSPDDQIFSASVKEEVSFILENLSVPKAEIKTMVSEVLTLVGLEDKLNTSIHALSGGQKQRLAVASVLVGRPKVLALDEPISQLDPINAEKLLLVLKELNEIYGVTIIVVEHRLHELLHLANRVVVMRRGQIIWDGSTEEIFKSPEILLNEGLRIPQPLEICHKLNIRKPVYTANEAVQAILEHFPNFKIEQQVKETYPHIGRSVEEEARDIITKINAVSISNLSYTYSDNKKPTLNNFDLDIKKGEIIALMGTNGAGKSTLLSHLANILKPSHGNIVILGEEELNAAKLGFIMQNPDLMLFNISVKEEIMFGPKHLKGKVLNLVELENLCTKLSLKGLEEEFPLALSRGQRLRVAIAAILACDIEVLLLDEPTTGQDISRIDDILKLIKVFASTGKTVVFCTHDIEVAARFVDRIVVMQEGLIIADGSPSEVFVQHELLKQAGLREPAALSIAKALGAGDLTSVDEVVSYVIETGIRSNAS